MLSIYSNIIFVSLFKDSIDLPDMIMIEYKCDSELNDWIIDK